MTPFAPSTGPYTEAKVNWILEADIVSFFDSCRSHQAEEDARGSGSRWVA